MFGKSSETYRCILWTGHPEFSIGGVNCGLPKQNSCRYHTFMIPIDFLDFLSYSLITAAICMVQHIHMIIMTYYDHLFIHDQPYITMVGSAQHRARTHTHRGGAGNKLLHTCSVSLVQCGASKSRIQYASIYILKSLFNCLNCCMMGMTGHWGPSSWVRAISCYTPVLK